MSSPVRQSAVEVPPGAARAKAVDGWAVGGSGKRERETRGPSWEVETASEALTTGAPKMPLARVER